MDCRCCCEEVLAFAALFDKKREVHAKDNNSHSLFSRDEKEKDKLKEETVPMTDGMVNSCHDGRLTTRLFDLWKSVIAKACDA